VAAAADRTIDVLDGRIVDAEQPHPVDGP
jgi:hypothetical protein